jgi:hypothetical protein
MYLYAFLHIDESCLGQLCPGLGCLLLLLLLLLWRLLRLPGLRLCPGRAAAAG